MNRSLLALAVTAGLAGTVAGAQSQPGYDPRYADPRPQTDPRYADPRYADPRYADGDDDRGRGRAEAVFYVADKFGGRSIVLDRRVRRLGEMGMADKISSIDIRSGTWLVCADDNFQGRCITLDRSVRRLDRMGFDDRISSVRPLRGRDR